MATEREPNKYRLNEIETNVLLSMVEYAAESQTFLDSLTPQAQVVAKDLALYGPQVNKVTVQVR